MASYCREQWARMAACQATSGVVRARAQGHVEDGQGVVSTGPTGCRSRPARARPWCCRGRGGGIGPGTVRPRSSGRLEVMDRGAAEVAEVVRVQVERLSKELTRSASRRSDRRPGSPRALRSVSPSEASMLSTVASRGNGWRSPRPSPRPRGRVEGSSQALGRAPSIRATSAG